MVQGTGKNFDGWNEKKKAVHDRRDTERLFFRAHEIWWAHLGVNVGYEQDGTGPDFERPVVVLKKYNAQVFLAVPLSTTAKVGPYYFDVGLVAGKNAKAIISQIRLLDRNRLINHIGTLEPQIFDALLDAVVAVNFSKKVPPPRKSGGEPKGHL